MRIFWVRHGQMQLDVDEATDFDLVNRLFNQEIENGLSARGRAEAASVARFFAQNPVDAVYSSHLSRARQSAEPTAAVLELRNRVLEGIGEIRTGRLHDNSLGARLHRTVLAAPVLGIRTKFRVLGVALVPIYFRAWQTGKTTSGESETELVGRLGGALESLRQQHDANARVALFSHGYLIHYQCARLVRPRRARLAAWRRPYVPNGSITEMELSPDKRPRLIRYLQTEHLAR